MRGRQWVGFGALEGSGVGSECMSVEVWDGVQRKVGVCCVGVGVSDGVQQSKAGAYAAATQGVRDVWV